MKIALHKTDIKIYNAFFFSNANICIFILSAGGQEGAKRALEEAVILPVLRPEVNCFI